MVTRVTDMPYYPPPSHNLSHLSGCFPGEVTVSWVLEMTVVARLVVRDVHLAVVIHPQFAYDDVVYCRRYLPPRIVVAGLGEFYMCDTWRRDQTGWHTATYDIIKSICKQDSHSTFLWRAQGPDPVKFQGPLAYFGGPSIAIHCICLWKPW